MFTVAPDPRLPRRIPRFEGLDSVATVGLDGAPLTPAARKGRTPSR